MIKGKKEIFYALRVFVMLGGPASSTVTAAAKNGTRHRFSPPPPRTLTPAAEKDLTTAMNQWRSKTTVTSQTRIV